MRRFLFTVIIAVAVICTIINFVSAANNYPLFIGDSYCFLPTSYFISHFDKLINPLYNAGLTANGDKFLFYPPLYPYVISFINNLLPDNSTNYFLSLNIINSLTIFILLASIYKVCKGISGPRIMIFLFGIVFTTAIFTFTDISEGRPEILCMLYLSLFILNNFAYRNKFSDIINGILIAINIFTSPISGFYLIILNVMVLVYYQQLTIKNILQAVAGGLIILVLFFVLYPYHIADLINSMRTHSRNVVFNRKDPNDWAVFRNFHILTGPLAIAPFVIVPIYFALKYIKQKKYVLLSALVILIMVVAYFGFKSLSMRYNLYVLSPLILFMMTVIFKESLSQKGFYNKALQFLILLILGINSTSFIKGAVVFLSSQHRFVKAQSFQQDMKALVVKTNPSKKIAITIGLWPYCLEYAKQVKVIRSTDDAVQDTTVKYIVFQQIYSGEPSPRQLPGFKIIKDSFVRQNVKLWGISLGHTQQPGYQTAIYERE